MQAPIVFNHKVFSELICETNRLLGAGAELDGILEFIFGALSETIPYDRMGIGLLNSDGTMRLVWVKSNLPVHYVKQNYSVSLEGSSLVKILETGEPRIIPDLRKYAAAHPESKSTQLILKDGILSSLTCALRANNRAIGAVFFSSASADTYSDKHAQTFMAIAGEISHLLEQARLRNYFDKDQEREKNLGHLLHDLRSPVSTIKSYLELVQNGRLFENADPEAKRVFSALSRNTEHLMSLLSELSELRGLKQTPDLALTEVNLADFLRECSENALAIAARKEISLKIDFHDNLPNSISIDPAKVRRVLENLFSNAIKFSRRSTEISFSVFVDEKGINFEVGDHGIGIPSSEWPKLFQEFGKTSSLPTEGEPSTGLGLAIAREIVCLHGGEIRVRSTSGKGSVFSFWIPDRNKTQ